MCSKYKLTLNAFWISPCCYYEDEEAPYVNTNTRLLGLCTQMPPARTVYSCTKTVTLQKQRRYFVSPLTDAQVTSAYQLHAPSTRHTPSHNKI